MDGTDRPGAEEKLEKLATQVAELAGRAALTVAVAESLTAGGISSALGAAPQASEWFRGGVVAYAPAVKFDVLGVTRGPVNRMSCAIQMARGVLGVLGAEVAVAATGVGGPGPDEGVPAGTVYLATARIDGSGETRELRVDGTPVEVVEATVVACLQLLERTLSSG